MLINISYADWKLTEEDKFLKKVEWIEKTIGSIEKMREGYYEKVL